MQGVVSAGVGLVCLVVAAVLIVAGGWQWPRLIVALVLTGSAGLLSSTIGGWVQRSVTSVDAKASGLVGQWTGVAVTGLLSLALLGFLGFWVYRGQIDAKTVAAAAVAPAAVVLIPGAVGSVLLTLLALVPSVLGAVIAFLFGLG